MSLVPENQSKYILTPSSRKKKHEVHLYHLKLNICTTCPFSPIMVFVGLVKH
jgi:hypothetical protein